VILLSRDRSKRYEPIEKRLLSAAIPVCGAMRVTPADAFRKTI
jgi:hypothetical protein